MYGMYLCTYYYLDSLGSQPNRPKRSRPCRAQQGIGVGVSITSIPWQREERQRPPARAGS
jgi:hypothetical protein